MNTWASYETSDGPATGPPTEELRHRPLKEQAITEGNLQITTRRFPEMAVVKLSGSAEMGEVIALSKVLGEVAEEHVQTLVFDLSDLSFIGSPGIAAVVCCHLRMRRYGGQIRMAGPQPAVLDVLERIRLTDLFCVYASVEQALAF